MTAAPFTPPPGAAVNSTSTDVDNRKDRHGSRPPDTTGLVATGHGRDAILIDIDERNAELAQERIGMFLTIEDHNQKAAA